MIKHANDNTRSPKGSRAIKIVVMEMAQTIAPKLSVRL